MKRYLFYWIEYFIERGCKVSHIDEMNVTTIDDKKIMTCEHFIKQPMQAVELKLNMNFAKNPNLIHSFDRDIIHPLIRNYSHKAFKN